MGRRKKKSIRQEYTEGLRRLAFGEIQDAVRLLYAPEEQILPALGEMDLFNISEIKRPKGGGMEIKFFDRLKALEKLQALEAAEGNTAAAFTRHWRPVLSAFGRKGGSQGIVTAFKPFSPKQMQALTWWSWVAPQRQKRHYLRRRRAQRQDPVHEPFLCQLGVLSLPRHSLCPVRQDGRFSKTECAHPADGAVDGAGLYLHF